jgi:hypothetical protein
MSKSCGSCDYFVKWKDDGEGLCEIIDCRTKSDYGKNCKKYRGKRYKRTLTAKEARDE